jgi:UPF0271 protein
MPVTVNCDMGESFGLWKMGDDAGLMPLIHIANVACGFHASDFNHMRATVRLAKAHGVKVGAHPAARPAGLWPARDEDGPRGNGELPDLPDRRAEGFLEAEGMELNHIKPHGSLYGMAARQEDIAHAVCDAADVFKVPLLGMTGTLHEKIYPRAAMVSWPSSTPIWTTAPTAA